MKTMSAMLALRRTRVLFVVATMPTLFGCGAPAAQSATRCPEPPVAAPNEPAPEPASPAPVLSTCGARSEAPAATAGPPSGLVIEAASVGKAVAPSGKAWIAPLAAADTAFVGILELAPGAAVPEHTDPSDEFIYLLSGGGQLTMASASHEVGPGSFIYMPAGVVVSFQNGDARLVAIQVFAGPAAAKKYDAWKPVPPSPVPPAPVQPKANPLDRRW